MSHIRRLFGVYRRSPFWLREIISRFTVVPQLAMRLAPPLRLGSYRMVLDYRDNASFKYASDRDRYESDEVHAFLSVIARNPGCLVIDVGANYGAFTLAAGQLSRFGLCSRVLAIEPDRRPARALASSIRLSGFDGVCEVIQVIAGDEAGVERLWVNKRSSADNRTHAVGSSKIRVRESYEVRTMPLDDVLRDRRLAVDGTFVIKMDVQGNELRVLRGMSVLLAKAAGWAVFFEHCPYLIRSAGLEPEAMIDCIAGIGAEVAFRFEEGGCAPLPLDDLAQAMRDVEQVSDPRWEGGGGNFLVARGMDLQTSRTSQQ